MYLASPYMLVLISFLSSHSEMLLYFFILLRSTPGYFPLFSKADPKPLKNFYVPRTYKEDLTVFFQVF